MRHILPESEYLERRAEEELEAAQAAAHPAAVRAHYTLASAYLERLYGYFSPSRSAFESRTDEIEREKRRVRQAPRRGLSAWRPL